MFKKGQSPAYYGSFYRRKASLSGDCSFFMRKMGIRGLGLDSAIYYKCLKALTSFRGCFQVNKEEQNRGKNTENG